MARSGIVTFLFTDLIQSTEHLRRAGDEAGQRQPDFALQRYLSLLPAIEHGAGWTRVYGSMACDAAATLWLLNRTDSIEVVEQNIREKVIVPDFRFPMRDSRLSIAHLCALQNRYDEASEWFAKSRAVLRNKAPGRYERSRTLTKLLCISGAAAVSSGPEGDCCKPPSSNSKRWR